MIYAASLGSVVKKSQKDKAFLTSIDRITTQIVLEPDVSGMDAVILGPKDVIGINSAKVQQAINAKHPDVCVIYLYQKDTDKSLITCEYQKQVKRLDDKAIDQAVSEFLGAHLIKTQKIEVQSKDFVINEGATGITEKIVSATEPTPIVEEVEEEEEVVELEIPAPEVNVATGEVNLSKTESFDIDDEPAPAPAPLNLMEEKPTVPQYPAEAPRPDAETLEMIAHIRSYKDFDLLKKQLAKDRIISSVLSENASYVQISQMLDVLDKNIQTIFVDTSLSPEERYKRIQDAGLNRAEFKAQANSMIISKTTSIFDKVTTLVDEYVTSKVNEMEQSLTKITVDKEAITSGSVDIEHLIDERTKMELDLMELMRNVIDVYKTMDALTAEELQQLDTDLPSSNEFVNSALSPSKKLFTPANTGALCTALMSSLQNQRISMSALESRIHSVINVIFAICEQNDTIIQYQANLIKLLKANKVEDIVIVDTMLKGVLRLYVGAEDTGSTATILTQSGIQSRASNTLIVDISNNGKWEDYGITPYSWDDFITMRPHEDLCVVRCDASNPEKVHDMIKGIKESLDHYRYVNVKMDYTQTDCVSQICDDAIAVHFISDCRASNVKKIAQAVSAAWTTNIAKKAILIDAPTEDIPSVVTALGLDAMTTKVVPIPHLTQIKGCALARKRPHLNKTIATAFEEAFR